MLEQDRINAMISYFFLGPLFLLAKKNTPLADPYVRGHAKQSSIIIGMTLIIGIVYLFVRPYIQISFLGIDLRTIVLGLIMGWCSIFLLRWAYRAYRGNTGEVPAIALPGNMKHMGTISWVYSVENEEDKIRILASMLPWVGIYLAQRYKHPLMERWRIIGSFFTCITIFSFLLSGQDGFVTFIFTIIYIFVFVVEWVYLFIYGRFISWNILDFIPSYSQIEAHIVASSRSLFDFIGVVFGKEKQWTYAQYIEQSSIISEVPQGSLPYFMPVELIAIPVWNIFTIPSLFIPKYQSYRSLIVQWLIITLLLGYAYFAGWVVWSSLWLLLLYPIVHIISFARSDTMTRAPIIGLWIRIKERYATVRSHINMMHDSKDGIGFTYPVEPLSSSMASIEESKIP